MKSDNNPQGARLLGMIQEKYPGYHPVLAMADIAHGEFTDENLRFAAHKEIATYIEPKLKQVEVRGELVHGHGRLSVVIEGNSIVDGNDAMVLLEPPSSMYVDAEVVELGVAVPSLFRVK